MPPEWVIDTSVLQKANALLTQRPGDQSLFRRRIRLLDILRRGQATLLMSNQLLAEYRRQVRGPRNDFVRAFFEIAVDPNRRVFNWHKRWSGDRDKARKCRYPVEDDHVLRTAIRPHSTTIFSEERRMLAADPCVYRTLRVHIRAPE